MYTEEIARITSMFNLERDKNLNLFPYINSIILYSNEVNIALTNHIYNELNNQVRSYSVDFETLLKNNSEFIEYTKTAILTKATTFEDFYLFYGFMLESYRLVEPIDTDEKIKEQVTLSLLEIQKNLSEKDDSCPFKEAGLELIKSDLQYRFNTDNPSDCPEEKN